LEYFNITFQDTVHQVKAFVPYKNMINVCTFQWFYCLPMLFQNSFLHKLYTWPLYYMLVNICLVNF